MNANNQQPSFETHWVNTKTIADTIAALEACKSLISCLYANAKGHEELQEKLRLAFYHAQDAAIDMRLAQKKNIIKKEEE